MIQLLCNECKKPIDPQTDNYLDLPQLSIMFAGKGARIGNMHFCDKKCLISWMQKNSEPSNIISIQNSQGPLG